MNLPLEGVKVTDLSRALAGPYCTALLADMGADVVKVESIDGGDTSRSWPPFEGGHSLYFDSTNRNKRSLALDFYQDLGKDIIHRLISESDVLVENFRPGTLERMGLSSQRLKELNPNLITASISGFGTTGPLKYMAGLDQVIQGMSGLTSVTGADSDHTYRVGVSIIDITTGMVNAFSIASALYGRSQGNKITTASTSLLETGLALSVFQGQKALSLGLDPEPQGNHHPSITPYGVFRTGTSQITLAVASQKAWESFCDLIELPNLVDDARFHTAQRRLDNRDELQSIIEGQLSARDAESWVQDIRAIGIPCGPIYTYTEALTTEQVSALDMTQHVQRDDGTDLPLLRGPISLDGAPSPVRSAPPALGEHSIQILEELGLSAESIKRLQELEIIRVGGSQLNVEGK